MNDFVDEEAPTQVFVRADGGPAQQRDTLWDANDVARYLKVSRSWVYHRAEAGSLPLRRVGGLLRFEPAAIRAFATGESPTPDVGAGQRERWTDGPGARRTRR